MNIKQRKFFPGQPEAVPPVYIESMTLQEVRCFGENQTLKFTKPDGSIAQWTVILGDNGVGKTTVLQCLAVMRPVESKNFEQEETLNSNQPDAVILIPEWTSKSANYLGYHRRIQEVHPNGFEGAEKDGQVLHIGLSLRSNKMDSQNTEARPWNIKQIATWHATEGVSSVAHQIDRAQSVNRAGALQGVRSVARHIEQIAGLHLYAYGASRRMAVIGRKAFDNDAKAESETLFSNESELNNAEEWLSELKLSSTFDDASKSEEARSQRKWSEKQLGEVLTMLPHVLPMVEEVRFEMDTFSTRRVRVKFLTAYGWLPIESLSYGYQTMISWIVDFTRRMYDRYPDAKDPLAEPAIVLVDEIDLHLHPKWQRELMGFLSKRFPKTQFIVTAHSPLIIQSEEVANVILLQREEGKNDAMDQVIVRQDDVVEIRKWRLDQILTSDLYGLESANAPGVEKLEVERNDILAKPELSKADERRLAEIEKELEAFPVFSSREAIEVEQLFKETTKRLAKATTTKANPARKPVAAKKLGVLVQSVLSAGQSAAKPVSAKGIKGTAQKALRRMQPTPKPAGTKQGGVLLKVVAAKKK